MRSTQSVQKLAEINPRSQEYSNSVAFNELDSTCVEIRAEPGEDSSDVKTYKRNRDSMDLAGRDTFCWSLPVVR